MNLEIQFRLYTRLYQHILENRLGIWTSRTGLIVQLTDVDTGRKGYGEVAPFPGFPSETYDQAFAFINRLCYPIGQPHPARITPETIAAIPPHLTATRFGVGCALAHLQDLPIAPESSAVSSDEPANNAGLLPRGAFALEAWEPLWEKGHRTLKWKIGLADVEQEIQILGQLLAQLPPEAKLRLDANGNLTVEQAQRWLEVCDPYRVEFFEQPLPPDQKEALVQLAATAPIPIALDESVCTLGDLEAWIPQWPGIFVVKVPLLGFPHEARSFLEQHRSLDLVFSSVLETAIARRISLSFAENFHNGDRVMGFGVQHWFNPEDGFEATDPETIWEKLE